MEKLKEQAKKKGLSVYFVLIMLALAPMILSVVVSSVFLISNSKKEIKDVMHNYMYSMAESKGEGLYDETKLKGREGALRTENLISFCSGIKVEDIDSSYAYVANEKSEMLYHPTESKIGEPVTNSTILKVCADMKAGQRDETTVVEYDFNGATKYASYYVSPDLNFVLVVSADESDVMANVNKMTLMAVIVDIILIVIIAAIAVFVSRLVAEPLKALAGTTKLLAEGNVNAENNAKSRVNEIVAIIDAVDVLESQLNEIVTDINGNVDELNINVSEVTNSVEVCNEAKNDITSAVEEVSRGAVEMAESVQNTASSMSDIGTEIEEIASLTDTANDNATKVTEIAGEARSQLEQLIKANKDTINVTDEVAEGIAAAGEAVKEISKAATAIADIASQTNLLSLNASIEAARAGEAGRGFAVVASEISSLAAQSDRSAKEIQEIIDNIVARSEKNTELAGLIKDSVGNEGSVLSSVSESFELVTDRISDTTDSISDIASKAKSLDETKNAVLDEISTLSSISEENAASSEETNASTQELGANIEGINAQTRSITEVAMKVSESIGFFKL